MHLEQYQTLYLESGYIICKRCFIKDNIFIEYVICN